MTSLVNLKTNSNLNVADVSKDYLPNSESTRLQKRRTSTRAPNGKINLLLGVLISSRNLLFLKRELEQNCLYVKLLRFQ